MTQYDPVQDAMQVAKVVGKYHAQVEANIAPLFLKLQEQVERLTAETAQLRARVNELEHQVKKR